MRRRHVDVLAPSGSLPLARGFFTFTALGTHCFIICGKGGSALQVSSVGPAFQRCAYCPAICFVQLLFPGACNHLWHSMALLAACESACRVQIRS